MVLRQGSKGERNITILTMAHKNKKRGKNQDSGQIRVRTPQRGQILGEVKQLLGDRRMSVNCTDKNVRICRIPGRVRRRMRVKEGDVVLVEPWSVQSHERGDVIWVYHPNQARWLGQRGFLQGIED